MPDSAPRMEQHPEQTQIGRNGWRAALLRYLSGNKSLTSLFFDRAVIL